MSVDVEKLSLLLEVQGQKFENQLKKQNASAYRIFKSLEDRASAMEKGVGASFSALGKRIAGVFAGLAVGSALNDIQKAADSYQKVINSLKVAGVSDADLPKTLDAVYQSAIKNAVPMEALASLFGRVSQAQTTLGTTSGELLKFTDLVAQGLRVSGTSATEASGSLLQLAQALSGGKVQAEEYNSLLDGQYPLLQAVAAGMREAGGDVAKLTQLVKAGEVSSKAFYDAARAGASVIKDKLASSVLTTAQATQNLQTEFEKAAGAFDKATGLSKSLAAGLDGIAGSMAGIGKAASDAVNGVQFLIAKIGELAKAREAELAGQRALSNERADRRNAARDMGAANAGGRGALAAERAAADRAVSDAARVSFRAAENAFATEQAKAAASPPKPPSAVAGAISIKDAKYAVPGDKDGKGSGGSSKDTLDSYEKALVASEKRRQALLLEVEMEGKSTFAKAKAREALELETAAKRANIPVTEAMRKKIEEAATGYAAAKVRVEEVQKAVEGFNDATKFFGDGITDALGDMILDGERAADTMKSLVKQLAKAALQAALVGGGPIGPIYGLEVRQ